MKSADPLDPSRLSLRDVQAVIDSDHSVSISLTLTYSPWEPSAAQSPLFEQSNALLCLQAVLERGGVDDNV
jgi:hypothetical protein